MELCSLQRVYPAFQNHERIALTFCEVIAKEDGEAITDTFKSSTLVYRVMENIDPVEIKSLD
jgi:hypothetical protein